MKRRKFSQSVVRAKTSANPTTVQHVRGVIFALACVCFLSGARFRYKHESLLKFMELLINFAVSLIY